jgi:hypothetical protein
MPSQPRPTGALFMDGNELTVWVWLWVGRCPIRLRRRNIWAAFRWWSMRPRSTWSALEFPTPIGARRS